MSVRWLKPRAVLELFDAAETLTDEQAIARDWLRLHRRDYDGIALEVRLHDGDVGDESDDPALRAMWQTATSSRADLVAKRGPDIEIIEVKVRAKVQSVTQVKRYLQAWRAAFPVVGQLTPRIVCRTSDTATEVVMYVLGGRVERVPVRAA